MNSGSTAETPTPGAGLDHIKSINLAVLGLVIGAALTFLTALAIVASADFVVGAYGWRSVAGLGNYPEMVDFVEDSLKLPVIFGTIFACGFMIYRFAKVRFGGRPEGQRDSAAAEDDGNHDDVRIADILRGLPGVAKLLVLYGWYLVVVSFFSAIFVGIPLEFYDSFFTLIEVLAGIFQIDFLRDPMWDRIDAVGSDITILVFAPAVYLYCRAERRRIGLAE